MRIFVLVLSLLPVVGLAEPSKCYGTTSNGSLSFGVKLPQSGSNFVGYSLAARIAGRTYVHSEVRDIIVSSYKSLESIEPDKVYKYAETGLKGGGNFKPHKTHQNGLSVDFMVPVTDKDGESVHLPTNALNKLGYNIEFNSKNQFKNYSIDFQALAAHLVELHKHATKNGHDIWRVIFAPELQPNLYETEYGGYLKENIQFSKKRSWVRHDEHYHVDFEVGCE
ncbi:peptidase [Chromatiales bacterium (ex Bugula neritina AB1)]|nr:peptidase [Chromatiales bacterium (ex Bugula neritina AB1)]